MLRSQSTANGNKTETRDVKQRSEETRLKDEKFARRKDEAGTTDSEKEKESERERERGEETENRANCAGEIDRKSVV